MPQKRTSKYKSITRMDYPESHAVGYFVRISWKSKQHRKFFSDKKHGDRLASLDAALEWRDATEKSLGKPRSEQIIVSVVRNKSGHLGIRRLQENHTAYYEATWINEHGKRQATRFSVNKHGDKKALRLAIKARERNERRRLAAPRRAHVQPTMMQNLKGRDTLDQHLDATVAHHAPEASDARWEAAMGRLQQPS